MSDLIWAIALAVPALLNFGAWGLWLRFNRVIAKWYGLEGLKATPPIAAAFRLRDWVFLIPKLRERLSTDLAAEKIRPAGELNADQDGSEAGHAAGG